MFVRVLMPVQKICLLNSEHLCTTILSELSSVRLQIGICVPHKKHRVGDIIAEV